MLENLTSIETTVTPGNRPGSLTIVANWSDDLAKIYAGYEAAGSLPARDSILTNAVESALTEMAESVIRHLLAGAGTAPTKSSPRTAASQTTANPSKRGRPRKTGSATKTTSVDPTVEAAGINHEGNFEETVFSGSSLFVGGVEPSQNEPIQ